MARFLVYLQHYNGQTGIAPIRMGLTAEQMVFRLKQNLQRRGYDFGITYAEHHGTLESALRSAEKL